MRTETGTKIRLAMPEDSGPCYILADVVRHVAKCFNVEVRDVMERVEKELAKPAPDITGNIVS